MDIGKYAVLLLVDTVYSLCYNWNIDAKVTNKQEGEI